MVHAPGYGTSPAGWSELERDYSKLRSGWSLSHWLRTCWARHVFSSQFPEMIWKRELVKPNASFLHFYYMLRQWASLLSSAAALVSRAHVQFTNLWALVHFPPQWIVPGTQRKQKFWGLELFFILYFHSIINFKLCFQLGTYIHGWKPWVWSTSMFSSESMKLGGKFSRAMRHSGRGGHVAHLFHKTPSTVRTIAPSQLHPVHQ